MVVGSVVILGSAYPLRGGGLATFNERLARAFMDLGHKVSIYTFSLQYPGLFFPGKTQYAEGPPPVGLDIKVKVNSINPLNWRRVGRELCDLKPDLLVIRYWLPFMAPSLGKIASLVKNNAHTRVVAIADNIIPHERRPGDKFLTRYFINRVHGFVCMSGSVVQDLLSFRVDKKRIRLCPHPLYDNFGQAVGREEARRHLGLSGVEKMALFFGFIRDYKGLDLLLKAFAIEDLKQLPVHLVVAGEFYTRPAPYHRLVQLHGIGERMIWRTDFIPDDQVRYYFSATDLVVQPYKQATQSGVTQVAYHFERPMVVTDVGGLPEMVPHGKAGYVVPPSPEAIAAAMADYFVNNREKNMVGTLKKEKKRFSWDRLVNSLLDVAEKTREHGDS